MLRALVGLSLVSSGQANATGRVELGTYEDHNLEPSREGPFKAGPRNLHCWPKCRSTLCRAPESADRPRRNEFGCGWRRPHRRDAAASPPPGTYASRIVIYKLMGHLCLRGPGWAGGRPSNRQLNGRLGGQPVMRAAGRPGSRAARRPGGKAVK